MIGEDRVWHMELKGKEAELFEDPKLLLGQDVVHQDFLLTLELLQSQKGA